MLTEEAQFAARVGTDELFDEDDAATTWEEHRNARMEGKGGAWGRGGVWAAVWWWGWGGEREQLARVGGGGGVGGVGGG